MAHAGDKPLVAFRVDASRHIGTGHVMRCLTLAHELAEKGFAIRFVCRAHEGHMADEIRRHGHEVVLLPLEQSPADDATAAGKPDYAAWLGAAWERDAEQTARAIAAPRPRWLVADHYAIDAGWERRVKDATGAKVMVIDGLANRKHDCELLLDQTYSPEGERRWDGLVPASCRRLVGPQFALLRPEFIRMHQVMRQRDGMVRRIFVSFGGVDQPNATGVALDALAQLERPDVEVDVVIGAANPHRAELQGRCQLLRNVNLLVQPDNVARLMLNADLAISAGGTILLEQCFMALPSVVVAIADNQTGPAQALNDAGAVLYIGQLGAGNRSAMQETIRHNVSQLLADPGRLLQMEAVARRLMARPEKSIAQLL